MVLLLGDAIALKNARAQKDILKGCRCEYNVKKPSALGAKICFTSSGDVDIDQRMLGRQSRRK